MAIGTVLAVAGLAMSAATTTTSFIQAGKQRNLQLAAEHDAEMAMKEARKKLDVNFYKQLAIAKEPYDLERQALLAAGAQSTEAGRESERGVASTAGRVQMAEQEGQGQIRSAMTKEQDALNKMVTSEDSRLRDIKTQLDLEEVAGAQMAAAQAAESRQANLSQGFQGLANTAQQAIGLVSLYPKDSNAKAQVGLGDAQEGAVKAEVPWSGDTLQSSISNLGTVDGVDVSHVGKMTQNEFQSWLDLQKTSFLKSLKLKIYDPNGTPSPETVFNFD
jgi:hypothetical protein